MTVPGSIVPASLTMLGIQNHITQGSKGFVPTNRLRDAIDFTCRANAQCQQKLAPVHLRRSLLEQAVDSGVGVRSRNPGDEAARALENSRPPRRSAPNRTAG